MFAWTPRSSAGTPSTTRSPRRRGDLDDPANLPSRSYDLVLDGNEIGGGLDPYPPHRRPAEGVRADRDRARRRRRRGSGSCSTRCATARRRTAGSRWASTGSSPLLAGRDNIREVIAFPKATSGGDPLTGAPAPVDPAQLRELGLRLTLDPAGLSVPVQRDSKACRHLPNKGMRWQVSPDH